jgi:ABC-type tungstate transport system substrate-binding protein
MEKKGDFLNQVAIISDLLEKINAEAESKTIILELNESEFNRIHKLINEKTKGNITAVKNKFSIVIGEVNVIFSKSNV